MCSPANAGGMVSAVLEQIHSPADLRELSHEQLDQLAEEIRQFIVDAVANTGGHLGSNLGAVELTIALHRVFDSPHDAILFDTGHQAYVHKLLTGRQEGFATLRQAGGMSGYPNRDESPHDWIENSHASTVLSYAHGLSESFAHRSPSRRVVAVIGDGSMTGGMAYEALNNLGHTKGKVLIVLNDNGRSYAPTISSLTSAVSSLRLNPSLQALRERFATAVRELPGVGELAYTSMKSIRAAVREFSEPFAFFEALGVRYVGPVNGHNIADLEHAMRQASEFAGPIVLHVLTEKGRGYKPAEDDDEKRLHDVAKFDPIVGPQKQFGDPATYTEVFSRVLLEIAEDNKDVVAITAAMPGPTGLLPFQQKFPDRFFDVGIAEQHGVTMAAGLAMGGARPIVAIYSTFLSRAFDQANLDVGMHKLPVIFAIDRAGITGDDGPSHHGVLDMALFSNIPGAVIFAPSSAQELEIMLHDAMTLSGPVFIRYPKGQARNVSLDYVGSGMRAKKLRDGEDVCLLAVGKLVAEAEDAARELAAHDISCTVWDARVVKPLDPVMIDSASAHPLVISIEDGVVSGGVGESIAAQLREISQSRVVTMGIPNRYISQGKPAAILSDLGLNSNGIRARVLDEFSQLNIRS
jgi:1-deoxy-D-xylulose-5-phosphate synthase